MAGWTGLEPAASGVTGRRSNQLNYHPARIDALHRTLRTRRTSRTWRTWFLVGDTGLEPVTAGV